MADPVIVAKSGAILLQEAAIAALREKVLPRATLITPNLPEAAALLGEAEAHTPEEAERQGRALTELGPAVLMKGGHARGVECIDLLVAKGHPTLTLRSERLETTNTHGTGCTLSAAIAACLAKGLNLPDAVIAAHAYLREAIIQADRLRIGGGHGPVHHFHKIWEMI